MPRLYVPGEFVLKTERSKKEIALLSQGHSCGTVARMLGVEPYIIRYRNKKIYKIDIEECFKNRIEKEGIPNRFKLMNIPKDFCNWYTGIFDGEGCFAFKSGIGKHGRQACNTFIQITLRQDDINTLKYIQSFFGGNVQPYKKGFKHPTHYSNPQTAWQIHKIKDLVEIMIPFFDTYPLKSKKRHEYPIWKKIIVHHYMYTLGGEQSKKHTQEFINFFNENKAKIDELRKYKRVFI